MKRPNTDEMAGQLFAQLDTNNQGYLEASDFSAALSNSTSSSSTSTSDSSSSTSSANSLSADDLFSALDSDGDGKITKEELSSQLKKLSDELDSQFNAMRTDTSGMMANMQGMTGMPPPPPDQSQDSGLSKDQLSQMASDASSAGDTTAATRFSNLATSFDKADTNGDGKVSFAESIAFEKTSQSNSSSSSSSDSNSSPITDNSDARAMMQLMQLMHSYGLGGNDNQPQQNSLQGLTA